ncbi:MAG: isochorismatase family cysteine hydrolase [Anaerovoracaceae bacterium]|nr:cysteine hydrolase [Bacillota bacterium]MDY5906180.1 isochorismatase family cysteine hydrolase [Anaerovoracaceae bacterium]
MKILVVVDMQNDFIDGALGTPEAVEIVPAVVKKIKEFDGLVVLTRDTHQENYMQTQEGSNLPVPHCIEGTDGWQINVEVMEAADQQAEILSESYADDDDAVMVTIDPSIFNKPTFGCVELGEALLRANLAEPDAENGIDADDTENIIESIEVIGLCTDICVISNAMLLKAFLPEVPVIVDAACCAGVTPESHIRALGAMQACQIEVTGL